MKWRALYGKALWDEHSTSAHVIVPAIRDGATVMDDVVGDDGSDESNKKAKNALVLGLVLNNRTEVRKPVELRGFEPLTFCMPS